MRLFNKAWTLVTVGARMGGSLGDKSQIMVFAAPGPEAPAPTPLIRHRKQLLGETETGVDPRRDVGAQSFWIRSGEKQDQKRNVNMAEPDPSAPTASMHQRTLLDETLTNGSPSTTFGLLSTGCDIGRSFLLPSVPAASSVSCTLTCDETSSGQGTSRGTYMRYDGLATGSVSGDDEFDLGLCPHTLSFTTPGIDVDLYFFVETINTDSPITNGVLTCTHSGGMSTSATAPSPSPPISLSNGVVSSSFSLYATNDLDFGRQFLLSSVPAFSTASCTFTCDETASGQGTRRGTYMRYDSLATGSISGDDEFDLGLCPHSLSFTTHGFDLDLYFLMESTDKHSTISNGVLTCSHSGGSSTTSTCPSPAPITTLSNGVASNSFNLYAAGSEDFARHFLLPSIPAFADVSCTFVCEETSSGQGTRRGTYVRFDSRATGSVSSDDDFDTGLCPHSLSFKTPGIDIDMYLLVETTDKHSTISNGVLTCSHSGGTSTSATFGLTSTTIISNGGSTSFNLYATESLDFGRQFLLPSVPAFASVSFTLNCDETSLEQGTRRGTYIRYDSVATGSAGSDDDFDIGLCPHSFDFKTPGIDVDLYLFVETTDKHSPISSGELTCSHSGGTPTSATTPSPNPTTSLSNEVASSSFNLYATDTDDFGKQFILPSVPAFSKVCCSFTCEETSVLQGSRRGTYYRYDSEATGSASADDDFDIGLCPHIFEFKTPGIDVDLYLFVETTDKHSTISNGVLECSYEGGTSTTSTTPSPTPTTTLSNGVASSSFSLYADATTDFGRQLVLPSVPAFSIVVCELTCEETSSGQGTRRGLYMRYGSDATGSLSGDDEFDLGLCPLGFSFVTPGLDLDVYLFVETTETHSTISNGIVTCTYDGGTPTAATTPSPTPTTILSNGVPSSSFNLYADETTDFGRQFLLSSVPAFSTVTCELTCTEVSPGQGTDRETWYNFDNEATGSFSTDQGFDSGLCPHEIAFASPGRDLDLYLFVETTDIHSTISDGVLTCSHSGGTSTSATTPSPTPTTTLSNGVSSSSFNLYADETTDYARQFLLSAVPALSSVSCTFTCAEVFSGQGTDRGTYYRFDSEADGSFRDEGQDTGLCPHSFSFISPGRDLDLYVLVETSDKYSTINNGVLTCSHSGGTPTSAMTPSPSPATTLSNGVASSTFSLFADETTDFGERFILPGVPALSYVSCTFKCDETSSGQGSSRRTSYRYDSEATGISGDEGFETGLCPHTFSFTTPGIDLDLHVFVETEDTYSTISNGVLECLYEGGTPTTATTPSPAPTTTLSNGFASSSFDLYADEDNDYGRQFLFPSVPALALVACEITCEETSGSQGELSGRRTFYNFDSEATGAGDEGSDLGTCPHSFTFTAPNDLDLYILVETRDKYSTITNGIVTCWSSLPASPTIPTMPTAPTMPTSPTMPSSPTAPTISGPTPVNTPSPSPSPTLGEEPSASSCFSATATVQVKNRGAVSIGDFVLTGRNQYQPVYSFGHYHKKKHAVFYQLFTEASKTPLEMTGNHLVFVGNQQRPIRADSVKIGDRLETQHGPVAVTEVSTITKAGIYMPLTQDGTIMVDGIVASSYVSLQEEALTVVEIANQVFSLSEDRIFHWWLSNV